MSEKSEVLESAEQFASKATVSMRQYLLCRDSFKAGFMAAVETAKQIAMTEQFDDSDVDGLLYLLEEKTK